MTSATDAFQVHAVKGLRVQCARLHERSAGTADDDHPTHAAGPVAGGQTKIRNGIATDRPWFAHYDPGVPHTLEYPAVPFQWFLADTAARYPHAIATIFGVP